jgi:hypothetical protein
MTTVLKTIHGSHLYGLDHPDSDCDTYCVVLNGNKHYARQTKHGEDDRMVISFERFIEQVASGVPQALEALYSPVARIDPRWAPFLSGLRPGLIEAQMRYRRTIINFGFHRGGRTGTAAITADQRKLRRHAVRLTANLENLLTQGSFNPRLTPKERAHVKSLPEETDYEDRLQAALEQALFSTHH